MNKNYCHWIANQILKTDKSVIVLEDLTKIKQSTNKTENRFKRTKHNNRMSQVPFYMLRKILTYKAPLIGKRVKTVSPYNTSKTNCMTGKLDGTRKRCSVIKMIKMAKYGLFQRVINYSKGRGIIS